MIALAVHAATLLALLLAWRELRRIASALEGSLARERASENHVGSELERRLLSELSRTYGQKRL